MTAAGRYSVTGKKGAEERKTRTKEVSKQKEQKAK
jgi:hypothetical protein